MMKKLFGLFRIIIPVVFLLFFAGCEDAPQDDVYTLLEQKAKIKTFPLTVVLTDLLQGEAFPDDLKTICGYSSAVCKTLPNSGILRLGPDQYYSYNSIASLDVSAANTEDEQSLSKAVQTQVNGYFGKTKLKDYDSLRAPNKPEYNTRMLSSQYVLTNKDSIYFFSANPADPSSVYIGSRTFTVYKDAVELRRMIDEAVCKRPFSISIFYSPGLITPATPATGMYAGDTCVGTSRFEKLNDGKGNLFVGKLLEKNSKKCGFSFPTGVAGDTCIGKSRYQRLHNGRGGFTAWQLLEKNSSKCGFSFPTGSAGDTCVGTSKFQKMHDGRGGFLLGNLIEKNSRACGYVAPKVPVATKPVAPPPQATTVVKKPVAPLPQAATVVAKPATSVVRSGNQQTVAKPTVPTATTKPATPANQQTVVKPTVPATTKSASQTTPAVAPKPTTRAVSDDTPPAPVSTDKRCARTSEPTCEQDERGNYTGRRVQYCYNSSGKIVRTIVLAKCDKDCRCF